MSAAATETLERIIGNLPREETLEQRITRLKAQWAEEEGAAQ